MWHLDELKPNILKEYVDLILPLMKLRVNKIKNTSIKNYLSEDKLKSLLCLNPADFEKEDEELRKIYKAYPSIKKVFDYNYFISENSDRSYKIASWIGVNTCVYCNRQYTLSITDDKKKVTRPDFDHFWPKSKYPYFALSIYNLIPSCSICNQKCKREKDLNHCLNPYLLENKDYFRFSYILKPDDNLEVILKPVDDNDESLKDYDKVDELIKTFCIKQVYNGHSNLELKDIYDFACKYSTTYLKEVLGKTVSELNITIEEAYRLLFGTEYEITNYHNRPLSKFKKDLLKEFGIID